MSSKERRTDDRWKELEVWQLADSLALGVYKATKSFPSEELYGLTSQLRSAALSVPTNIVEGCSRMGNRELHRYSIIALGSLGEVKYLLTFANRLGYLADDFCISLGETAKRLGAMLWRFSNSLKNKP
jgi:four helix bundle protein